jgi:hypothetical protein
MFLSYLTTLSVSRQCSVNDRMVNECGAAGGVGFDRGTYVLKENMS